MDRVVLVADQLAFAVDRLAKHIQQPAEGGLAHRNHDRRAGVHGLDPPPQTIGGGHGNAAHPVVAQVLLHLQHQPLAVVGLQFQGVVDLRQLPLRELHIHHGADDLNDPANRALCHGCLLANE